MLQNQQKSRKDRGVRSGAAGIVASYQRRRAKVMKKMTFGMIAILVVAILVFAGCVSFTKSSINEEGLIEDVGLEEYETLIASSMDVPVTNKDGEQVTDEAGEALTTNVFVEEITVAVTNAAGEVVTNASGEQQTTKAYVDTNSGKIISNPVGEVKTTVAYKGEDGKVVATTKAPEKTTSKSGTQPTTAKSGGQTATLPSDELNTTVPQQPANTGVNEFTYLQGGSFYIQGTMIDSSGQRLPLEMAVTPNSVYMLSNFEGAAMGMLINDGTTYMIYPAEKSYLELSSAVMKAMGMSTTDLISSADLDYSKYDLAKADSTSTENVNGANCTVYIYNNTSGSTRFFMDGNKLVRFATYNADGTPDVINEIGYISDQVPADKISPPADYKKYSGLTGMFSFISLLGDVVGE